ncbi:MAG: hypothetical protein ACLGGX_03620 [Bdellovibrionia bacterium]
MCLYHLNAIKKAEGLEISEEWHHFSYRLNNYWDWQSHIIEAEKFNRYGDFDLIINTSCEHMTSTWYEKVPEGTLVALQNTDLKHSKHINTCEDLTDLKGMFPLKEIYFEHTLKANENQRFTLIGRK